jgi:serine/threonine protein kinase
VQILDAIEQVHKEGFIHRDIKPSNVLMDKNNSGRKIFLTDFGISKVHLRADKTPLAPRQTNEFRGTVAYASLNAHYRMVFIYIHLKII